MNLVIRLISSIVNLNIQTTEIAETHSLRLLFRGVPAVSVGDSSVAARIRQPMRASASCCVAGASNSPLCSFAKMSSYLAPHCVNFRDQLHHRPSSAAYVFASLSPYAFALVSYEPVHLLMRVTVKHEKSPYQIADWIRPQASSGFSQFIAKSSD